MRFGKYTIAYTILSLALLVSVFRVEHIGHEATLKNKKAIAGFCVTNSVLAQLLELALQNPDPNQTPEQRALREQFLVAQEQLENNDICREALPTVHKRPN